MSALAECAVIGIMLIDPQQQPKAFGLLTAEMFEMNGCANIFLVCKDLTEKGRQADTVSVIATLPEEYRALAAQCVDTVPSMSGYNTYLNCVLDDWRRRKLTAALRKLLQTEPDADAMTAAMARLVQRQEYIMSHQRDTTAKAFGEGVTAFLAWLRTPSDNISTGFVTLDRVTGGLARRGVTVIAARPGHGKTTLALQMAAQISTSALVLYQSLEMSKEQLYTAIFARWLQMDSLKIARHNLSAEEQQQVEQAADVLSKRYKLVLDDGSMAGLATVAATIREKKPEVVFIDHLGLLTPEGTKEKRNDELAGLTRGLKRLAMQYNIAIVELVQAARASEGKRITMADMFGSATIEHDADMIIGVNPESGGDTVNAVVEVIKNRHGPCGLFDFAWIKSQHQFVEVWDGG